MPEEIGRQARQVARSCMAFRARALSRRITAIYEEAIRPLGLRASQMNVMTAVAAAGGARLSTIAEMIAIEPSSLSRVVDVMSRNGWVELRLDPDDERARIVALTRRGAALYREALPGWRRAQARTRELLGEDGAETFVDLANRSLRLRAP